MMKKLLIFLTLLITLSCTGNVYRVHIDEKPISTLELNDVEHGERVDKMAISNTLVNEQVRSSKLINIIFIENDSRNHSIKQKLYQINNWAYWDKISDGLTLHLEKSMSYLKSKSKHPKKINKNDSLYSFKYASNSLIDNISTNILSKDLNYISKKTDRPNFLIIWLKDQKKLLIGIHDYKNISAETTLKMLHYLRDSKDESTMFSSPIEFPPCLFSNRIALTEIKQESLFLMISSVEKIMNSKQGKHVIDSKPLGTTTKAITIVFADNNSKLNDTSDLVAKSIRSKTGKDVFQTNSIDIAKEYLDKNKNEHVVLNYKMSHTFITKGPEKVINDFAGKYDINIVTYGNKSLELLNPISKYNNNEIKKVVIIDPSEYSSDPTEFALYDLKKAAFRLESLANKTKIPIDVFATEKKWGLQHVNAVKHLKEAKGFNLYTTRANPKLDISGKISMSKSPIGIGIKINNLDDTISNNKRRDYHLHVDGGSKIIPDKKGHELLNLYTPPPIVEDNRKLKPMTYNSLSDKRGFAPPPAPMNNYSSLSDINPLRDRYQNNTLNNIFPVLSKMSYYNKTSTSSLNKPGGILFFPKLEIVVDESGFVDSKTKKAISAVKNGVGGDFSYKNQKYIAVKMPNVNNKSLKFNIGKYRRSDKDIALKTINNNQFKIFRFYDSYNSDRKLCIGNGWTIIPYELYIKKKKRIKNKKIGRTITLMDRKKNYEIKYKLDISKNSKFNNKKYIAMYTSSMPVLHPTLLADKNGEYQIFFDHECKLIFDSKGRLKNEQAKEYDISYFYNRNKLRKIMSSNNNFLVLKDDEINNKIDIMDHSGLKLITYKLDHSGNLISVDSQYSKFKFEYDLNNRLETVIKIKSESVEQIIVQNKYDNLGRMIRHASQSNSIIYDYNDKSRSVTVTKNNKKTIYVYNLNSKLMAYGDSIKNLKLLNYDTNGRVIQIAKGVLIGSSLDNENPKFQVTKVLSEYIAKM